MKLIQKYFKLKENNTTIKTEIGAGFVTFLAMVYIIPVNSNLMANAGMPIDALILATALITILITAFNGLFANTPIAMSVGMGLNAYFTFTVCLSKNIPWQTALGAVFISGFIFLILSLTKFRIWVIKSIPRDLRMSISAGIGCFIAFMGLQQMGILVKNEAVIVSLGNFYDAKVLFGLFGVILTLCFWAWNMKGAFILSVFISALVGWFFHIGDAQFPDHVFSLPVFSGEQGLEAIFGKVDIMGALSISMIPVILTFFVTELFDSIGTISGIGARAKLFEHPQDGEKKLGRTLMSDALGTTVCAFFGTSTATAFVESTAGVEAGGRTGLTAITTAFWFVLTLFLLPIFKAIPANSIYPILVVVGILMFMEVQNINFKDPAIAVASFFIIIMMPLSYSITNGFSFGFLAYILIRALRGEWHKISSGVIVISAICLLVFILQ